MATEKFHHQLEDGREIVLPHMKNIKVGIIRKLRNEDETGQMFGILEAIADPDTIAIIDDLDGSHLATLMEAWHEASKVTMGESPASASS